MIIPTIRIAGRMTNAITPMYGFGVPDSDSSSIRKRISPKLTRAIAAPARVTGL
jgi:hypothetical protein